MAKKEKKQEIPAEETVETPETQETAQVIAKNFSEACKEQGWKPYHCRCIWAAEPENAGDPANY